MTELDIIIFAIADVAIILKCKEIEDWAKNELERRTE